MVQKSPSLNFSFQVQVAGVLNRLERKIAEAALSGGSHGGQSLTVKKMHQGGMFLLVHASIKKSQPS